MAERERRRGGMNCEANEMGMPRCDKLSREGRVGFEHMAEVHNAMSEELSFRRVLGIARNVPGIALYFLHVSAGRPTAGCVSLPETQRPTLLRRPPPAARPAPHLGGSYVSYDAWRSRPPPLGTLRTLPAPAQPRSAAGLATAATAPSLCREIAALARLLANRRDPAALALLHARVAELYQLSRAEFEHILATFPLIPESERDAALRMFLGKAPRL